MGGGVGNLNVNVVREFDTPIQTHIVTIISELDTEIMALKHKLTKYKQIKQGMMRELLTGRTRLI